MDTSRPIDPFAALDAAGVLVFRRRLDHLAGLYLPPDPRDGRAIPAVLINVAHPPSKQRFTAAHELGHHLRDHAIILDSDTEMLARGATPASDRERLAEAFAAWFLMPRRLVLDTLTILDLRPDGLDADGAYALALALGTSYAATVRHLADMGVLTTRQSEQLLRVAPQAIKRDRGGSDVVADSWKDVHRVLVTRLDAVTTVEGDAIVLEAPEIPSSGYVWQAPAPPAGLTLVRDDYLASGGDEIGGRGWRRFLFRVDAPGRGDVILEKRRPWQRGAAIETARVAVTASPPPAPGIVQPRVLVA